MAMLRQHKGLLSTGALLLSAVLSLTGCDDAGGISSQYSITEDEAAVIVAHAFGSSTYGLTAQLEEIAGIANGGRPQKKTGGSLADTDTATIIRTKTGEYGYNFRFLLFYGQVGTRFVAEYGMRGTYTTPAMTSLDTLHVLLQFSDLASDSLRVSGYSWRVGRQESNPAGGKTFSSEILAKFDDLRVRKSTQKVIGGAVTFTLIERFPDNGVVSLPGTYTYLRDHQAALVINRKTFAVDFDTGLITPR